MERVLFFLGVQNTKREFFCVAGILQCSPYQKVFDLGENAHTNSFDLFTKDYFPQDLVVPPLVIGGVSGDDAWVANDVVVRERDATTARVGWHC